MQRFSAIGDIRRANNDEKIERKLAIDEWFRRECEEICANSMKLCDTLLKLCYSNDKSKRFVWNMCGDQIVRNLLNKNQRYSYFVMDNNGDIEYRGEKFTKITVDIRGNADDLCDEREKICREYP